MKRNFAIAAAALGMMAPWSPAASAADQCAPRGDMIKALDEKFHENPTAQGIVNPNVVLEIFVSQKGTWTILATGTDGNSCVLSAGEGWHADMLAALPES